MGRLQFDFMVAQGLKPPDVLLDIGCGSLRGGVHFIAYLDAGNYLGMDKEQELIDLGVEHELGDDVSRARRPELVASDSFEFERFTKRPTFALAQSLFTHLTWEHVDLCLAKLHAFVPERCRFFATFLERGPSAPANPRTDHDHSLFSYTRDEMRAFADAHDWRFRYIGDWRHPRGQVIVEYVAP